jgi:hypothetical protein
VLSDGGLFTKLALFDFITHFTSTFSSLRTTYPTIYTLIHIVNSASNSFQEYLLGDESLDICLLLFS